MPEWLSEGMQEAIDRRENIPYAAAWKESSSEEIEAYRNAMNDSDKELDQLSDGLWSGAKDVASLYYLVNSVLVPFLDRQYNTNYKVVFIRENGNLVHKHEKFYCGY